MKFSSLRPTSVKGVHEHIMHMRDNVAQLKKLEVDISESFLVYYILNTLLLQYGWPCVFKREGDWWWNKEKVQCKQNKEMTNLKPKRKGKVKYLPKQVSRNILSVSFVKRRDTWRGNAPNFRNSLQIKVIQPHLFVMNLILLNSMLTHGGLILEQQSILRIPCRVCET